MSSSSASVRSHDLSSGNAALREMNDAGMTRDFKRYFDSYEVLRKSYIEAAETLVSAPANRDSAATLATLDEWERMLRAARAVRKDSAKNGLITEELPPDVERLVKEAREKQAMQDAEWAPIEVELDESLDRIREFRERKKN